MYIQSYTHNSTYSRGNLKLKFNFENIFIDNSSGDQ